jgi:hypothetical protein
MDFYAKQTFCGRTEVDHHTLVTTTTKNPSKLDRQDSDIALR